MTLMVCSGCGAQHAIEIAMRDRGPERFEKFDAVVTAKPAEVGIDALSRLRSRLRWRSAELMAKLEDLPRPLGLRLSSEEVDAWRNEFAGSGITFEYPMVDAEPNPWHGPLLQDRLLGSPDPQKHDDRRDLSPRPVRPPRTPDGEIDLALQACCGCFSTGTLTPEYTIEKPCPHCQMQSLEVTSFWVT